MEAKEIIELVKEHEKLKKKTVSQQNEIKRLKKHVDDLKALLKITWDKRNELHNSIFEWLEQAEWTTGVFTKIEKDRWWDDWERDVRYELGEDDD